MKTKDFGTLKLLIPEESDKDAVNTFDAMKRNISLSTLYRVKISAMVFAELNIDYRVNDNGETQPVLFIYARKRGSNKKAYVAYRVIDLEEQITDDLLVDTIRRVTEDDGIFWYRYNEEFGKESAK